ncbi:MAG: OmpA family protein [Burkholderiales bacterium]
MKTTATFFSFLLGALMLCAAAPLAAQETTSRPAKHREGWYIAPMVSRYSVDSERQTDDGTGYVLSLGHRGDVGALELSYLTVKLDPENGGKEASLSGADLTLLLGPYGDRPILSNIYGVVGFGYLRREDHPRFTENDGTIFGDVGLGYMLPFDFSNWNLALRTEARYRYDFQQSPRPEGVPGTFNDVIFNVGLQFSLDRDPEPVAEPPPPPPEPVAVAPVPADYDADGVSDLTDQCPASAPGSTVNEVGCEPPPPKCESDGTTIVLDGCKPGDKLSLTGVNFDSNQATLQGGGSTILDAAAQALAAKPELKVEIGGHTDNMGDDSYNQALSERRAETVRAYLVEKGVAAERLSAAGYGETAPLDSNDTNEGRARNRRVELKVVE